MVGTAVVCVSACEAAEPAWTTLICRGLACEIAALLIPQDRDHFLDELQTLHHTS